MDKTLNGVEPNSSSANSLAVTAPRLARTWVPHISAWRNAELDAALLILISETSSCLRNHPPKTAIDEVEVNDSWVISSLMVGAVSMHLPCQRQHVELQKSARYRRPSAAQGPAGLAEGSVDSGFDEAAASCRDTRSGCRLPHGSGSHTVCEGVEADAGDGLR